jgi:exosortase F-associated protein
MQNQPKSRQILIVLSLLAAVCLFVGIRALEKQLFYDPLLVYFKGDYQSKPLPEIDYLKWFLNMFLRFALNTLISLALLWIIFKNKMLLAFLSLVYVVVFVVIMLILSVALATDSPSNQLVFYARRFIIQPILLLLFLPASYFHLSVVSKK